MMLSFCFGFWVWMLLCSVVGVWGVHCCLICDAYNWRCSLMGNVCVFFVFRCVGVVCFVVLVMCVSSC